MECIVYHTCDGVALCTVTDTEAGKTSKQCKQNTQPFLFQTSFQSVHGTTDHGAVFCSYSVFDCQNGFTVFRSDTEAACQPYPEYRTRTTRCDGCSYTDDVTGTNGCRKGCCQRTETRYVTACFFIGCYRKFDTFEHVSLNNSCTDCQEYMGTKEQYQHDRSPYNPLDTRNNVHHINSLPSLKK